MTEMTAILIWLLGIELTGLLTLPIASYICRGLPDRGYTVSKPLGIVLLTYFTWLLVSLHIVRFGLMSVVLSFMILFLLSALVVLKKRPLAYLAGQKGYMLKAELIFLIAFLVFAFILSYKPDILARASEDFMDYAFLQSILRSTHLPPPDPWFSGEILSYYYFGQLVVAVLTVFTGIPSSITYNLAVAMFFGLTVSTAYGLTYSLTRRSLYGIVAAIFVSVAGILSGFLQLLVYLVPSTKEFIHYPPLASPDLLHWLLDFDFWTSTSTVIHQAFVFYPFHTFLHGNLHAQMIGFPFQLMFLALCLGLLKDREAGISSPLFIIVALSLGFFAGLNIWEFPTYSVMLFLVLFIKAYKEYQDVSRGLRDTIRNWGTAALISVVLYIPYYAGRDSGGFYGILPVMQRTGLLDFFQVFGLFVFIIISFLLVYYAVNRKRISMKGHRAGAMVLALVLIIGTIWGFQLILLLISIVLLSVYAVIKLSGQEEENFSILLITAGGLVALFPEVLYIVDAMPWPRFNTIMKLYLQVWFLWGIASAYGLYYIHRRMKNTDPEAHAPTTVSHHAGTSIRTAYAVWTGVLVFLIFASLVHPIASTVSWTAGAGVGMFGNTEKGTLDGARYLQKVHRGDYMAIKWIEKNIQGNPTILEAPGEAYEHSSQIATFTGIPTVLGWKSHETMWNNNWSKIDERETDVNRIYSTENMNESLMLLKKYDVQYIYIGENELAKYRTGLDKFEDERYFERVYREHAEIYRVKYGAE